MPRAEAASLLEDVNDILYSLDSEGRVLAVAGAVEVLSGYRPDELVGHSVFEILEPAFSSVAREHLAAKREGREERSIYEVRLRHKDGVYVWAELSSRAQRDPDGGLRSIVGIIRDISARKAAEAAAQAALRQREDLWENANDILYVHDLAGRFTAVNGAALRAYGYTREELLSRSIGELVDPAHLATAQAKMREKTQGGAERTPPYEILTRAKDGRPVWVEVSTRLVRDGGQPVAIHGIARDITARREAEAGIRLVQDLAVEISRAPDFKDALDAVLRGVCDATGWARGEAWVVSAAGPVALSAAWPTKRSVAQEKFDRLSRKMSFQPTEGLGGRIAGEPHVLWIPDLGREPSFLRASAALAAGYRSLVAVPVRSQGRLVALLLFLLAAGQDRPEAALRALEAVAGQLGSLIARRQTEDRLATALGLMRAQFEASPVAMFLLDAEGQILAANGRMFDLCGVPRPEVAGPFGTGFLAGVPQGPAFEAALRPLYERGDELLEVRRRWYRRFLGDLRGPAGEILGKVGQFRDVTEAREMELRLEALAGRT